MPRLTQPSTLRGTVKWVSAFGLSNNKMAMVDVGHVAAYTGGLNAQVGWLGRRVGGRPARWPTFVKMNRVNSRSGCRSRWQHHKHCLWLLLLLLMCIFPSKVRFQVTLSPISRFIVYVLVYLIYLYACLILTASSQHWEYFSSASSPNDIAVCKRITGIRPIK